MASLDRFINKTNILFMPKRSRLEVKKTSVRFSNGFFKMAAKNKMADHSKTGLFCLDFEWSTSLDRFGMNKIFFMTLFFIKWSRLANPKTGHKKCPKSHHSKTGQFGIQRGTVFRWSICVLRWNGPDIDCLQMDNTV